MQDAITDLTSDWQIVIFIIDGKANHVGLSIPNHGLADLSLLGSRLIPWNGPSLPKGDRLFFTVQIPDPTQALAFLKRPGLLTPEIIKQEKACRGWHLTAEAPDFVRRLRDLRSRDPETMNCVEWIVFGLELGGLSMPLDILTPTDLLNWCNKTCPRIYI